MFMLSKNILRFFRPSGSTTAAIIQMLHFVYLSFDSGCDYVRCLMVDRDYSKAFDSINHTLC